MTREEAINKVRQMSLPKETMEILEALAPELAESEDERMIREIKRYIKEQGDKPNGLPNGTVAVADMIAWLEKRGGRDIDCPQKHQDNSQPNGCIVLEDFNGGEGFYKLNLDYLNKKQVEEVEEMVRTWNKESKASNENIKACIGMCLTDANEQRFKDYNTSLKDCLAYLEKQKDYVSNNFDDVWDEEDCEEIIAEGQKLTPRFKELLKEVCHAWYDRGAKLEKQKDVNKAIEAVERIDKYIDENLANAHDMKDSNPDKKYYRGWDDALGEMARILQDVYSNEKQKESLRDFIDNFPYSVEKEEKPVKPSDDELQRHQDELYNFKVFAAKQAKEHHILFVHDFEWHNFCAGLLSYFNEKQKQDWSEEDKQNLSVCLTYIKDTQLRDWLIEAFHKSSKWSEEDKSFYDSIIYEVIKEGMHPTPEQVKWFKSLPERFSLQPKQELSEEETKDLVHILKVLDDCYVYGQHDLSKTDYDNLTSTIKSLKPSWKPSEHQMSILKAVKEYVGKGSGYWGEGLGSLIDDLEKLI